MRIPVVSRYPTAGLEYPDLISKLSIPFLYLFLALSRILATKAGGSHILKAVIRICIWDTFAMAASALVGYLFGVQTS